DYTQAIADYTQAIKLKPDYANAYTTRGLVYREKGDKSNAIQDFKRALEFSKDPTLQQMVEQNLRELGAK
ncbi:MAG: tetratricopeptide repeat protein, partial [Leptolyngbyaceae cyanobacterium CRU_2_3]|nr:tetratricopeptide repeat protein [Leptolyngbyaceae cyanobacterium CRU_2_3]